MIQINRAPSESISPHKNYEDEDLSREQLALHVGLEV